MLTLGSQMVVLAKQAESLDEARQMLVDAIKQEKLLNKFKTFLSNQGGDDSMWILLKSCLARNIKLNLKLKRWFYN